MLFACKAAGVVFSCMLAWTVLNGAEFATIMGGKNKDVEEGYTFYNKYCQMAFLNPSVHNTRITGGDFDQVLRRRDVENRYTLDENEAKLRIFFKPEVQVKSADGRQDIVLGEKNWMLVKQNDGVKYFRRFRNDTSNVASSLVLAMSPDHAYFTFEGEFVNSGQDSCMIDLGCAFTFLRNDVEPLHLTLRRVMMRYVGGKRTSFSSNETTVMNGQTRSYWWRRVIRDSNYFGSYFNRELIPFTHPRLVPPDMFGFSQLAGRGVLIWDLANTVKIKELDISWDANHGEAKPVWSMRLTPGESVKVQFRVLTIKGMEHFDEVDKNWAFGYHAEDDLLKIVAVPLQPCDRLAITATVNDNRNQVLVNQRSEVAAMTPFNPGQVELRSSVAFQPNLRYPIKLMLGSLVDNSRILEISGNIVP